MQPELQTNCSYAAWINETHVSLLSPFPYVLLVSSVAYRMHINIPEVFSWKRKKKEHKAGRICADVTYPVNHIFTEPSRFRAIAELGLTFEQVFLTHPFTSKSASSISAKEDILNVLLFHPFYLQSRKYVL